VKDINLLPEDIKPSSGYSPKSEKKSASVTGVIVAVLVLALIGGSLALPYLVEAGMRARLNGLQTEIDDAKFDEVRTVRASIEKVTKELNGKSDVLTTIDNSLYSMNEVMASINSIVPKGVIISGMTYSNNRLELSGKATDMATYGDFLAKINRLELFEVGKDVSIDEENSFNISITVGRKDVK
jgi:Tfp pilus assembly protein PilN